MRRKLGARDGELCARLARYGSAGRRSREALGVMLSRATTVATLGILLAGCSTEPRVNFARAASQSTPASWDNESVWVFVLVQKSEAVGSITLRFHERPAESCVGGEWKKAEILMASGVFANVESSDGASFSVAGKALTVGLTNNLCDAYNDIRGEISDVGFSGRYISESMFSQVDNGSVFGARVSTQ